MMESERDVGLSALIGMRVDRLDMPQPDWLAISLRRPGHKEVLLACLSGPERGLSLRARRPEGAPADGNVTKLRHHVGGRRIEAVGGRKGRQLDLFLAAVEGRRAAVLRLFMTASRGNAIVLDASHRALCALRGATPAETEPTTTRDPWDVSLEDLRRAGQEADPSHPVAPEDPVERQLKRRLRQLKRRLKAIQGDIDRGRDAAELRHRANLLVSQLHRLTSADKKVEVDDYGASPARVVTLFIAAHLDPKAQADAWFKQARRFERGVEIAAKRHAETASLVALCERLLSGERLDEDADGDARRRAVQALGIDAEPQRATTARRRTVARRPYRVFLGHGDQRILVGRGASDNDALTLHHAAPHDRWLHARGAAGAHVVVPLDKGQACPHELLMDAALLAAHFSKFNTDGQVEVDHTQKRYVRKPKGSPPGLVRVDQVRVVLVKNDPVRLKALMASELG